MMIYCYINTAKKEVSRKRKRRSRRGEEEETFIINMLLDSHAYGALTTSFS